MADQSEGSLLIAEGEPRAALAPLHRSWTTWHQLEAPYEAARVRALIATACRAVGDTEPAAMEIDAARWIFERLGAIHDLKRLDSESTAPTSSSGLTRRETEVLIRIAAGATNMEIAAALNARQMYDRAGPLLELLRSAASADPEVKAVARNLEEERHRRSRLSARALVEKGALRHGISAAEAARTLWTLSVPELYLRHVRDLALTSDAYEQWLASLLQHALLPD